MRTQSAGIRDLDRKIGHLVPQDRAERMIEGALAVCCTKQVPATCHLLLISHCFYTGSNADDGYAPQ